MVGAKNGDGKAGQRVAPPLRGRTRRAIVGCWRKNEPGHFDHLNAAIAVTLRALYFEGLSQDKAGDVVIIQRWREVGFKDSDIKRQAFLDLLRKCLT